MSLGKCTDPKVGILLPAYELHALGDEDTRQFELHLMECDYCTEQVQTFRPWSDMLREDPEIQKVVNAHAAKHTDAAQPTRSRLSSLWSRGPFVLRPAVLLSIIALLLVPAIIGVVSSLNQSGELRPVQTVTLSPLRSQSTATFRMGAGLDGVINFPVPGHKHDDLYRVVVSSGTGEVLLRLDRFNQINDLEMGQLFLPFHAMKPGLYKLSVEKLSTDSPTRREYYFRIAS